MRCLSPDEYERWSETVEFRNPNSEDHPTLSTYTDTLADLGLPFSYLNLRVFSSPVSDRLASNKKRNFFFPNNTAANCADGLAIEINATPPCFSVYYEE